MCVDDRNTPGESWNTFVWGHEVVFEIEVGEVLAIKQLCGQFLQAATGHIHGVYPLRCNLTQQRVDRTKQLSL